MTDRASKLQAYIGFAVRSGKAIFGADALMRSKRPPEVVLIDAATAENTRKKVIAYAQRENVAAYVVEERLLGSTLKREKVKVFAVADKSLGGAIKEIMNRSGVTEVPCE